LEEKNVENNQASDDMDFTPSGLFLPGCHLSAHAAQLPIYAYLFPIYDRSIEKTWTFQRLLLVGQAHFKL
jgi:hypothetical protein